MEMHINADQLNKPFQRVTLQNTGIQDQVVINRFKQGVTIKPNQRAEVDMVTDELQTLIDLARPDRGFFSVGSPRQGQPYPPHPLKVVHGSAGALPQSQDRDAQLVAREQELARREAALLEREAATEKA